MFEILESDLFQDNVTMALYSFGGVNNQYGATSWAVQETGVHGPRSCNDSHDDYDSMS